MWPCSGHGVRGLRVGVDPAWNSDGVDPATQEVVSRGGRVLRIARRRHRRGAVSRCDADVADWVPNCAVEAAVAHEATYPARKAEYGPVLAAVIEAGRRLVGLAYQEILLRRLDFRGRVAALSQGSMLLLSRCIRSRRWLSPRAGRSANSPT